MTIDQTPKELERDAERVRAQIADTAEQLKDKMSPGQMMDEVFDYFKDGDSNRLLGNLKNQVRDNPLALALVGSGLAWLMMGSGPSGNTALPERNPLAGDGANKRPLAGSNTYGRIGGDKTSISPAHGSGLAGSAGALGAKVSAATSAVTDSAARAVHDLRDTAADGLGRASDAGSAAIHRAQSTFLNALEREPLVLGALGVAVGAAIGAMLPSTQIEKDYLGEVGAKAREKAEGLVADGIDKAKEVGSDVYRATRDEADRQGLMPHGKPLADKLSEVAKAAGSELKGAVDETIGAGRSAADATDAKWSTGNRS